MVKKKKKEIRCPDCNNKVTSFTRGTCKCGANKWKWNLYDEHLVLNCLKCDYQFTFTVDYPFTDFFMNAVLGDKKGRKKNEPRRRN